MANVRFGQKLRELRNSKGLTQQQVADELRLKNKSTLGSWEVGKSEPDAYTFLKLCRIYEVEDIYSAFDEVGPQNDSDDISSKYRLLRPDYKELIVTQMNVMLDLQAKK